MQKSNSEYYLVDLFFPQFKIYLEVNEKHHDKDDAKIRDARRRFDIAEAAGLTEFRISTSNKNLDEINKEVLNFVEIVRACKQSNIADGTFSNWDYETQFSDLPHRKRGMISIDPNACFRYQKDALKCFGYEKEAHLQRGGWQVPDDICDEIGVKDQCLVWFPHLNRSNSKWLNSITDDGKWIYEEFENPKQAYADKWKSRIVMARSRDKLNRNLYRFVGVFQPVPEKSTGLCRVFQWVATSVKTYPLPKI